ncbi:MAG: protein TolR [Deltaproteobacteria bacterium]|nr:protein TolR [Deltaproteobacteria bacterium]
MSINSNRDNNLMAEINVTPLVDVMLVLLIIFMVTAPLMMQGVDVNLPQTSSDPIQAGDDHLVVSIDKRQKIFLNDRPVELADLLGKLAVINRANPDQKVYLRADKNVAYGLVVRVMDGIKDAGFERLGVVTSPEECEEEQKASDAS